jgi:hypothetical protein
MSYWLIISPTPTHPTNAGNRARILAVCDLLKSKGHRINFLYIYNEQADSLAMSNYFGEGYHEIKIVKSHNKPTKFNIIFSKFCVKLFRLILRSLFKNYYLHSQYNKRIDNYYHSDIDKDVPKHDRGQSHSHQEFKFISRTENRSN